MYIISLLAGKSGACHTSSDEENNKVVDHEREIDLLKKESKLSIDDVLDQLPKGYLESRANEFKDEVQFKLIVVYVIVIYLM